MLNTIRHYFFNKSLNQSLKEQKRQRKTFTLESAKSIGLLFDAGSEKQRQEVLALIQDLEKKGKQVQALAIVSNNAETGSKIYDILIPKDLSWTKIPKPEKSEKFTREKFDLLLCLNPNENITLNWLSVASQAAMKIGMATEAANDFDLQIDTPAEKGIRYFIEQLNHYIHTIR